MDATTRAVRDQYDVFPYPDGSPVLRVSWDVRYLLSRVERCRPSRGALHALDAGCGRGLGVNGAASMQPDVRFTAVDISETALSHARERAEAVGLKNVTYAMCDLMTLDSLSVPDGGFDAIYSSGVLHHLSDPEAGLRHLAKVLAPHGVLQFMVYGDRGRQALTRFADAVKVMLPDDTPLGDRLAPARRLAQAAEKHLFPGTPWANSLNVPDAEFVDRFLNVNETAYDVPGLWALAEQAGMRVVGWVEPADWDPAVLVEDPDLRQIITRLPAFDQFRLVDLLAPRPKLECLLAHRDNAPRAPLALAEVEGTTYVVSPDVTFSREVRNLRSNQRIERLMFRLRAQEPRQVNPGAPAQAALLLADQTTPITGRKFVQTLERKGIAAEEAKRVLHQFEAAGLVFRPHPNDI